MQSLSYDSVSFFLFISIIRGIIGKIGGIFFFNGYGKKIEVGYVRRRKLYKEKYTEMLLLHVIFVKMLRRLLAHRTTWNDFGDT